MISHELYDYITEADKIARNELSFTLDDMRMEFERIGSLLNILVKNMLEISHVSDEIVDVENSLWIFNKNIQKAINKFKAITGFAELD